MWFLTLLALGGAQAAAPVPLAKACPDLPAAERAAIERVEKGGGIGYQLAWYARDNCVSLAEAKRRMEIQNRDAIGAETEPGGPPPPPDNSIGSLSARLEKHEAATFAGLWIEHKPFYRVVVAFTRDAAATLRKYTSDPLFVAVERPGPSQAELRATQDRIFPLLERYGARPSHGGSDIKRGKVEVHVTGDLTRFREAVARGEVELPPYVEISEPGPMAVPAPPLPPDWRKTVRAFPRYRHRSSGIELSILRTGTVVLEGGCMRLGGERRSPVIVWPNESALDLSGGKVRVLNRMNGKHVEIGRTIVLGGNARALDDARDVIDSDPPCPGPYYLMGNFEPYERFEEEDFRRRVEWLQRERKFTPEQALAEARAERDRARRFGELGRKLATAVPDIYAGMQTGDRGVTILVAGDESRTAALVPPDLEAYVRYQRVLRPVAALKAERDRLLDQIEAAGLKASVNENVLAGTLGLSTEDVAALSRAARAGRIQVPPSVEVSTNGTGPDGYREEYWQRANRALESARDFAEIRALVGATKLPSELVAYGPGPDRPPTRAQSLEISRMLIALGFTARDIRLLRAQGPDPVKAWQMMNGRGTPDIRATVTRDVAVGELVELIHERLGDGFRSTAVMRVVDPLKGDIARGATVRVRLVSGLDGEGKLQQANDEPLVVPGLPASLDKGSRWLMFLSRPFAAHHARMSGGRIPPERSDSVSFWGMIAIHGNRLGRFAPENWPKALAGIRAMLQPVDRAFDSANRAAGGQLMTRTLE